MTLLIVSWFLRVAAPVSTALNIAFVEAPFARAIAEQPNRTRELRDQLTRSQSDEHHLRIELAALEDELTGKIKSCRQIEPPPLKPALPLPRDRWDNKDLSVLRGCWLLGREAPAVRGDPGLPQRESDLCNEGGANLP
jgi:hypothetical protein